MSTHTQFVDPRTTPGFNLDPDRDTKGNFEKLKERMLHEQPMANYKPYLKERKVISPGTSDTICNTIRTAQFFRAKSKNDWVEIGHQSWFSAISDGDLNNIREDLIKRRIIVCDKKKLYGEYGSKAFYYKFTPKFFKDVIQKQQDDPPVLKKCNVKKRIERVKKYKLEDPDPELPALLDYLAMCQQRIHIKDIDEFNKLWNEISKGSHKRASLAYESFLPFIFRDILEQNIKLQGNRFFCPLNRFPKEFRHFMGLDNGIELFSLDIDSCHPTFLYCFYRGETDVELSEMRKYQDWLEGDFYRRLLSATRNYFHNKPGLLDYIPRNRGEVKTEFLTALNSEAWSGDKISISKIHNTKGYKSMCWQTFKANFPILFERLTAEILSNKETYRSKRNKLCAGTGLTAIELKVMRPVYTELMKRGIWCNPSHDGLTVEEDGVVIAAQLMNESLRNHIGLGSVSVETWTTQEPVSYFDDYINDDVSHTYDNDVKKVHTIESPPPLYTRGFLDDVSLSSTVVAKPT